MGATISDEISGDVVFGVGQLVWEFVSGLLFEVAFRAPGYAIARVVHKPGSVWGDLAMVLYAALFWMAVVGVLGLVLQVVAPLVGAG